MLKKLIKYDLKWTMKVISIFMILGIFFATIGRLLSLFSDSVLFNILSQIANGTALSMLISAIFNVVIRSWIRIITNFYKDEAYLTHTLPIKRETQYLSKVLSTLIAIVVTVLILLLGLIIMYYNESTLAMLNQTLNIISSSLNSSVAMFIISLSLIIMLQIIFIVFSGNFGIIFGHTFNQNKSVRSVIFGFLAYSLSMVFTLGVLLITSLFNEGINSIVFGGNTQIEIGSLTIILWIAIVLYAIYNSALYLLTNKIFKKGVNID